MQVRIVRQRSNIGVLGSNVLLVHPNNRSFKLFVLVDTWQHVIDVLLELLFDRVLLFDLLSQFFILDDQAFHLHPEIGYNEFQVSHDSAEVLHLLAHLGCLLLESSSCLCVGLDVFLQFFDLVIQHKLELLELLSFELELRDSAIFVFDCGFALRQLRPLTCNCVFMRFRLLQQLV